MKQFLIFLVVLLFVATNSWAADDGKHGLRDGQRPQVVPLVKNSVEPQETRMPGRMEIVPDALRGQAGRWVSPFNFQKNGIGQTAAKPLAIPFDDNSRFSTNFVTQAGNAGSIEALGDVVNFNAAMNNGATYVRNMQAAPPASGWDWVTTFFTNQGGSYTNLYGVCALGMYYAYVKNGYSPASLFTGMTDAANAIVAYGTSDARDATAIQFLMLYNDLPGVTGTAYKDAAKAKYDWRITNQGAGTASGFAAWLRDTRGITQGYANGIIGWDLGAYAVDAQMLYDRYGGSYNTDADDIAEVLYQDSYMDNPGLFDIVDDAGWDPTYTNTNYYWYNLGISGLIDAFNASNTHTDKISALAQILLDSQADFGGFCGSYGVHANDDDWQTTAYVVMTLEKLGLAYTYPKNTGAYYLAATQHTSGGWVYSDGTHYPEIGGECTSALSMASAPSELWVDDDYNSTNTGGHVWGYDAFASIQSAIDASIPGSIINVYPGNYSETASGRTVLASTPGAMGPYQFGLFIDIFHNGITIRGVNSGGTPIADYSSVAAFVQTNATNNFGPSGVWVEGDNVTISGLRIWQNVAAVGYINKTIECIGNNFALKYCQIVDVDGGSIYMDDWRFDTGTNTSYLQSYTIEGNLFQYGASLDISSGAGFSGAVSGRQIINNTFTAGTGIYWALVSFNGSGSGVPWFVHQVGGAIISGNNFSGGEQYIRSRGTVPFGQFNWADYWNNNTFDKKVMFGANPPTSIGEYSYPNTYGTFNNVRRIGALIQPEIDHASSGDIVLAGPGTYPEWDITINKPITLRGSGITTIIDASSYTPSDASHRVIQIDLASGDVTVEQLKIKNSRIYGITSRGNTNPSSVITIDNVDIEGYGYNNDPSPGKDFGIIAGYGQLAKVIVSNCNLHDTYENVMLFEQQLGETDIHHNTITDAYTVFYMTYSGNHVTTLQKVHHNTFNGGEIYFNSATNYGPTPRSGKYTNIEVSDNTFNNIVDGMRAMGAGNDADVTPADGEIAAPRFLRNTVNGVGGGTNFRGLQLLGYITDARVENNLIQGVAVGIRVWTFYAPGVYPVGTKINYNSIVNCGSQSIRWDGPGSINASGNWFGSKFSATFLPTFLGSIDYTPWLHSGNDVGGNPLDGFQPDLSTLWVDDDSPQTGTTGRIQEAVDMVSGSTINVLAGTYSEILNINKSLDLLGPNSNISPNTGARVTEAILTGGLNVDNTSSKIVAVKGFKFNGVTSPFNYNGNASGTITAGFTFKNNIIENSSGQLAIMLGTSLNSATAIIEDNKFSNMTSNAMQLVAGGGNLSANILKNVINTTVNAGINTDGLTNSTISENTISSTGQQGIQIAGPASNVTVNLNNISNANTTLAADRGAIRLYGSSFTGTVSIYDNILTNSFNGIAIRNGENISGKDIRFYQNKITGNVNKGAYHGGTGMLTAKYNWWGDVTGPYDNKTLPGIPNYNNPGGLGNAVTPYVDYNPWNLAPTYYNTPATAYKLYISSSTAVKDTIIYPNTAWGVTAYEAPPPAAGDDWDFTAPVDFYIVPEAGSEFGACDITLEWDNTLYSFAGVSEVGGLFDSPHFFNYNTLGGTNRVTINASTSDYSNFNTSSGNYIAKVTLNLLKPGYGPIKFKTMDFRYFDGLNPPLGVYVTGKMATVKSYLGDVASLSPASEATGDGLVEVADLNTWTYSYWSGVPGYVHGMTYYKVKCDVGPTNNGTIFGQPAIDSKIQFEDLVIFAMSYGASANGIYPKIAPPPTEPVEISVGKPLAVGSETLVPLFISGAVQDLRAASLSFSGSFGKLISAEKGDLLNSYTTPVMVMSRTDGNNVFVDLSILGADVKGLGEQGQLIVLRFEGKANVNITSAELRNTANVSMLSKLINNSKGIPTEFGISQNYPNPFNPSTMISYQVPVASMVQISVFNSIGEKVGTLVNEVKEPGYYEVTWNASAMPSGVYFFRINAGEFTAVKKMMLTK